MRYNVTVIDARCTGLSGECQGFVKPLSSLSARMFTDDPGIVMI